MNERIRELADQARKHFPKTETSGEYWVFDEQKFAELIVRECISAAEDAQADFYVINNIKTRFGVEE